MKKWAQKSHRLKHYRPTQPAMLPRSSQTGGRVSLDSYEMLWTIGNCIVDFVKLRYFVLVGGHEVETSKIRQLDSQKWSIADTNWM